MAVQSKRKKVSAKILGEMKEAFVQKAGDLWDNHIKEASEVLEDSENGCITLNFSACMDFGETAPKLTTRIRFSKSYTDEGVDEFDDPDQMPLGEIPKVAKGKRKKGSVVEEEM